MLVINRKPRKYRLQLFLSLTIFITFKEKSLKNLRFTILLVMFLQPAFSNPLLQKGFPFIEKFDLAQLSSDLQNWMSVEAPNGFVYVANSSKLFEFDGVSWKTYSLPNNSALRSLATDSIGRIFVGGTREFGYFYPDKYGRLIYYSLSARLDDISFESVWRILKTSNGIYFVTGRKYIYKFENNRLTLVVAPPVLGEFRASVINDTIYFYDVNAGFGLMKNDTLRIFKNSLLPKQYTTYFFMKGACGEILAGIRQKGLYYFNPDLELYSWKASLKLKKDQINPVNAGGVGQDFVIKSVGEKLNRVLSKSVLYFGLHHKNNYILSTLKNGIVLTDEDFNITNAFRKGAGLTSDAIYHLNIDRHGGLWISGEMGLSYIRFNHPFRFFDQLNGIDGIIISVKYYQGQIFVGTTQGLYSIQKHRGTIDKLHKVNLITKDYIFNMDIEPLAEYPDYLLVSSLRNLLVLNTKTRKVQRIADVYGTFDVCKVPFANNLYMMGHTKGIDVFRIIKNSQGRIVTRKVDVLSDFQENVRKLTFEEPKKLWVSTAFNGVFTIDFNSEYSVRKISQLNEKEGVTNNSNNVVFYLDDTVFLATEAGLKYFGSNKQSFLPYGNLYKNKIFDTVSINSVLPTKNKLWFGLDRGAMYYDRINRKIEHSAFQRLSFMGSEGIDQDEHGNVWLSGRNQLIAIDTANLFKQYSEVPVTFRKVIFGGDSLMPLPDFKKYKSSQLKLGEIPFSHNSLKLNIACPAYQTLEDLKFSHKLKGIDNEWSSWHVNPFISYSYLPGGEYVLDVKARDANGKIIGSAKLDFIIANPFYLTTWAIIFYVIAGGLLIYLFILLYVKRLRAEKRRLQERIEQAIETVQQQKEELEQQAEYLTETNKELEKLSVVAEHTDNAVAIMDSKGYYKWINNGYTRMYGYSLKELQARPEKEKIGKYASFEMNDLINVWFGDKKPIIYESLNKCKTGDELWVQTVLTPILDEKGNISKLITIDTDISALKEAEQKIEQQRDEISQQRDMAVEQRDEIMLQKQEITDSIIYAQRIQNALFPSKKSLDAIFSDSFIFDLPRDIVSGDFFWTYRYDNISLLAVADCTGHGVPGAFMSLIGLNFLNEIVVSEKCVQPNEVLNQLREKIITALQQSEKIGDNKDGMDIALVQIDHDRNTLTYAGANNAVYILRNDQLIELEPDKMPISIFRDINIPFTKKEIDLQPDDFLYMFSDGYIDQFGGKRGKKFKTNNFRNLILSLQQKTMDEQLEIIRDKFYKWKGSLDQVDDVLVIGTKL